MSDRVRAVLADMISRARDRRRSFRREAEEVFNRQVFVTILFLAPAGKAIELSLVGQPHLAARFAAISIVGLLVGIHWKRLAAAASDTADAVEEAVDPDE